MGAIVQSLKELLVVVCGLMVLCVSACVMIMLQKGITWRDMDWNNDGTTSLMEVLATIDIEKHEFVQGGKSCIEYISDKDGLTVRTTCSK